MKIVKPDRAVRSFSQQLVGSLQEVFPLLCPVREADWIKGRDPALVVSSSGLAEPDCAFTAPATPVDAVWYITRHEPKAGFIEMVKITPTVTACRLTIHLRAADYRGALPRFHAGLGSPRQSLPEPCQSVVKRLIGTQDRISRNTSYG